MVDRAAVVVMVPHGQMPDAAAAVRSAVGMRPLVALGGGRVVDADEGDRLGRRPVGRDDRDHAVGRGAVGPPPAARGARGRPARAAGAGDRRPGRDGVAAVARARRVGDERPRTRARGAVHAAREPDLGGDRDPGRAPADAGFAGDEPNRPALALGALLAGHALGLTGFALHHVLSQTIVRTTGAPHGAVNAVMLPHVARPSCSRARRASWRCSTTPSTSTGSARAAGTTGLGALGIDRDALPAIAKATAARRADLAATPGDAHHDRRPAGAARRRLLTRRCASGARRRRTMRGVERMRAVVLGRDGDDGAARRPRAATRATARSSSA